jgi:hypothetical protein
MLKSDCKWMKSTHLITRKGKQGALNQPSNWQKSENAEHVGSGQKEFPE